MLQDTPPPVLTEPPEVPWLPPPCRRGGEVVPQAPVGHRLTRDIAKTAAQYRVRPPLPGVWQDEVRCYVEMARAAEARRPQEYATAREVAAHVHVRLDCVRNWINTGYVPAVHVANAWAIRRADLFAFLALTGITSDLPRDHVPIVRRARLRLLAQGGSIAPHPAPLPAHPISQRAGCRCPRALNQHGLGVDFRRGIRIFYVAQTCPLHGLGVETAWATRPEAETPPP